ncbi:MAG: helix-turn-helix domain-containing protein [Bacillota bacterium]|nr:helix-turn-helix domain-containing protein [Bacillota bacterium]
MERLTISVEEMAKELGISKPTAYMLANSEGFPVLKIGKRKVVPVQGLQEWIKKNSSTEAQQN